MPASNYVIGAGSEYSRDDGTPAGRRWEEVVGGLEDGRCVAFGSGTAAIAAVFDQLAVGAVAVLPDDCCQGVAGLAAAGAQRVRRTVERMAVDDTAGWVHTCAAADRVWLESPSKPLRPVADLEVVCAAPRTNADRKVVSALDQGEGDHPDLASPRSR